MSMGAEGRKIDAWRERPLLRYYDFLGIGIANITFFASEAFLVPHGGQAFPALFTRGVSIRHMRQ